MFIVIVIYYNVMYWKLLDILKVFWQQTKAELLVLVSRYLCSILYALRYSVIIFDDKTIKTTFSFSFLERNL